MISYCIHLEILMQNETCPDIIDHAKGKYMIVYKFSKSQKYRHRTHKKIEPNSQ